ncbi:PIR protein, partial [Plasmodium vivax]
RGNFTGRYDSLNGGSHDMEEDYANSSNTSDDMYTLLKSSQFRTGTVTFLTLGTAFLGYAYYKFTPVGSWFRNRKGRKNEIAHEYFEQISKEPFQPIPKSVNTNSRRKRVQIAYHQSGD